MVKFSFQVGDPQQRAGSGALARAYWTYTIACKTDHDRYRRADYQVRRRYSDFEWFRAQLSEMYPFSIIPPIPEKDIAGAVEKYVSKAHNPQLLEYRQRALRKFLARVGAHPTLQNSPLLEEFLEMDEGEWERRMKEPKRQGGIDGVLAGFSQASNAVAQQWTPSAVPPGGAGTGSAEPGTTNNAYESVLQPAVLPSNPQMWDAVKHYIGQLEESVKTLRERLEQLVRRRRGTSAALGEFGRNFELVGQIEAQLDSAQETQLSRAATSVGHHASELSHIYSEHATQEMNTVVEALQYYVGICAAAKETLKRLQGVIATRDSLEQSAKNAASNRDKLIAKGSPAEKVNAANSELQQVEARLLEARKHVETFEANLREELRRFHREKQFDMKEILRQFVSLQRDYSDKMKRSWDDLVPTVEDVRPE